MKKILAALIAVMMVLSMAVACSSPEEAAAPAQEAAPAAEAQQEAAAPAADDEDDENDEDAVKNINIEFFTTFSFDTEVQKSIEDALNAIAEPEIGVHANIHFNTPATVSNLVNIGIPAGDQIDLFCFNPVPGCSIATMAAQNQVIDMALAGDSIITIGNDSFYADLGISDFNTNKNITSSSCSLCLKFAH